jgi:hypothetical protein
MPSTIHILAAEQHVADLHRSASERRRDGRLARKAEKARRARGFGVRRGLRVLRPAV